MLENLVTTVSRLSMPFERMNFSCSYCSIISLHKPRPALHAKPRPGAHDKSPSFASIPKKGPFAIITSSGFITSTSVSK